MSSAGFECGEVGSQGAVERSDSGCGCIRSVTMRPAPEWVGRSPGAAEPVKRKTRLLCPVVDMVSDEVPRRPVPLQFVEPSVNDARNVEVGAKLVHGTRAYDFDASSLSISTA